MRAASVSSARPSRSGGRRLGTFRVADPLRSVEEARSGLNDAFLLVGDRRHSSHRFWRQPRSPRFSPAPCGAWPRSRSPWTPASSGTGSGLSIGSDEIGALAESFDHMLDRLEAAFRRQEDFVSDASHELRTPLTVLRGQIELLERETDPEVRRRSVETVLRELDHMSRLVDDMLTLAAAEGGDLVRHPCRWTWPTSSRTCAATCPCSAPGATELAGVSDGVLEADPERLSQVFRNLVRNAVAATGPGGRITDQRDPARRFGSSSRSRTTGPGIPSGDLERVFDRLHRAGGNGGRGTGPASGYRSRVRSWRPTAAGSWRSARQAGARPSVSTCRIT